MSDDESIFIEENYDDWESLPITDYAEYLENNFDYWYDLFMPENDYQESFTWNEMSYRRWEKPTTWDSYEPTELEMFEQQEQKSFREGV